MKNKTLLQYCPWCNYAVSAVEAHNEPDRLCSHCRASQWKNFYSFGSYRHFAACQIYKEFGSSKGFRKKPVEFPRQLRYLIPAYFREFRGQVLNFISITRHRLYWTLVRLRQAVGLPAFSKKESKRIAKELN